VTYAKIVVIGASSGGIEALSALIARLPAGIRAPILVVMHISPESIGYLPQILRRHSHLTTKNASDGERLQAGTIYVAPPDLHMVVTSEGLIRTPRGPRENRSRPAIDPLFRSAALAFGPRVIGAVLSGGLDDGSAGLRAIKMCGGTTMVQDPTDAVVNSMPIAALRSVTVDYVQAAHELGTLIGSLVADQTVNLPARLDADLKKELEMEVDFTQGAMLGENVAAFGTPSMFTCPECHGTLVRLRDDRSVRFRCHTGHAFTADSLMADLHAATDGAIWNAVRTAHEGAMLLSHMADHWQPIGPLTAEGYREKAAIAFRRAELLRKATELDDPLLPQPEVKAHTG
jgi:two-component system chemotaxis response regulator CheB